MVLEEEKSIETQDTNIPVRVQRLINTPNNFKAGTVANYLENWERLTSNNLVLNVIKGVKVQNVDNIVLPLPRKEIKFNSEEQILIDKEINNFLKKEIIHEVSSTELIDESCISNVFLRPKPDGSYRMILNLKSFNSFITKQHFKMDSLNSVLTLIKKDCYFAKLDLKDAYYSIPIYKDHRKYFRFYFKETLYEFCALPQGYTDSPRLFTKILKVPLSSLRSSGFINSGYLDDIYLQGNTYEECLNNVNTTASMLDSLGFTIHQEKSNFVPSKRMEFLGFIMDSSTMLVYPNRKKVENIQNIGRSTLEKGNITIQQLAELIGHLVSVSPGNTYAPIFYKRLEILRNKALKLSKGRYEETISLPHHIREDILWWIDNVDKYPKNIQPTDYTHEMFTDASLQGYGVSFNNTKTGGLWNSEEKHYHINVLELLAVKYGLFSLCKHLKYEHIHLFSDNSVTVASINKKGSCKNLLNNITRDIWLFCMNRHIMLTVSHIPGKNNTIADHLSRCQKAELEWHLNPRYFKRITEIFGSVNIDLFASRLNYQLKPYVSWQPDPDAFFINAFHLNWQPYFGFCFPPFSIIPRILQKIEREEADILLIVPWWTSQTWFPKLGSLLTNNPVLLPQSKKLLILPTDRDKIHPLHPKLKLVACKLSGKHSKTSTFLKKQQTLYLVHGEKAHQSNMPHIQNNSLSFVVNNKLIRVNRL